MIFEQNFMFLFIGYGECLGCKGMGIHIFFYCHIGPDLMHALHGRNGFSSFMDPMNNGGGGV